MGVPVGTARNTDCIERGSRDSDDPEFRQCACGETHFQSSCGNGRTSGVALRAPIPVFFGAPKIVVPSAGARQLAESLDEAHIALRWPLCCCDRCFMRVAMYVSTMKEVSIVIVVATNAQNDSK